MTSSTNSYLNAPAVIGPFSHWPRKTATPLLGTRRRKAAFAGIVASTAVFFHCVAPMLIGA